MEDPNISLDRAKVIDHNFITRVTNSEFPSLQSSTTLLQASLSESDAQSVFQSQLESRHLDLIARKLRKSGQTFYTIGSSGHEGNAAIAQCLQLHDMAFLHYRSGAFMLQRGRSCLGDPLIKDHLFALMASSDDPIAQGRHKVFGSLALNIPPQTSTIASHLPKALGAAFSIGLSSTMNTSSVTQSKKDAVILCSFGDGSFNHSTAQGAFNSAQWIARQSIPLPIIFVCEDNGIGISVPTPQGWIVDRAGNWTEIHYIFCDGLNIADVYQKAMQAVKIARTKKQPVFLHMRTVRLLGHAGSDIEFHYHSPEKINATEANDPLLHSAQLIQQKTKKTNADIVAMYQKTGEMIERLAQSLIPPKRLSEKATIMASLVPPKRAVSIPKIPHQVFEQVPTAETKMTLAQCLNQALKDLMYQYENLVLFGEDVGKKGGVYRITANLQKTFGIKRVFDTVLDEQTILGTAIGMAHNNLLPIPEIQFLAYLVNAYDQLRGEAASLSFFSSGQFTNPMVLRLPGMGYQKGFGGHFHNDNGIAFLRELPGIIIACPSNGNDAARMLRQCVAMAHVEQRVVVFIEPIALYHAKDLHEPGDGLLRTMYPEPIETIPLGQIGIQGKGEELAIITYGNGMTVVKQALPIISKQNDQVKVIDLRWLAPLPLNALHQALKGVKRVLIVDEGRKTGSVSETLITGLLEKQALPTLVRRITGDDCFIPLGQSWSHILPSVDNVVAAASELLVNPVMQ